MTNIPAEQEIREQFSSIVDCVAAQNNFPDLKLASLEIVSEGRHDGNDVFPMREIDSRQTSFEFSIERFTRFQSEFEGWLGDSELGEQDLREQALFLFLGAAVVRPVVTFEQFERLGRLGPRKVSGLSSFYKNSSDIESAFQEIFGDEPEGNKTVVTEITDQEIIRINGLRVATSYLYGSYATDPDKKGLFANLLRESRTVIAEVVERERPDYCDIGKLAFGRQNGTNIGNRLCANTLPPWLIAMAVPIIKESYGHLCKDLWQEKFHIDVNDISEGSVAEDDAFVFDDVKPIFMPSHARTLD